MSDLVPIAFGMSEKSKNWKNKNISWFNFVEMLSKPKYSTETMEEYHAMSKQDQAETKSNQAFISGYCVRGKRTAGSVLRKQMLVLDADYASAQLWSVYQSLIGTSAVMYSTHSSTPDAQRYRLVIPLSHAVEGDDYVRLAYAVMDAIGEQYFDKTCSQTNRLFYMPSVPSDAKYEFYHDEGTDWLIPEDYLKESTTLSFHAISAPSLPNGLKSPTLKDGVIGAFCKAFTVTQAIDNFLTEYYTPTEDPSRYTYLHGHSSGGLVLYDNGEFAYSFSNTDPASVGHCINAFDLLRVHKFEGDTKATLAWCADRKEVKEVTMIEAFSSITEDDDWVTELEMDGSKKLKKTLDNVLLILNNDPNFKGMIRLNTMKSLIENHARTTNRVWSDNDDNTTFMILSRKYKIYSWDKLVQQAISITANANAYHPVKEYVTSQVWDGVPRVLKLFINCFGVEDNVYYREASQAYLVGAIKRVFEPGCKMDHVPVLKGGQGARKSMFLTRLAHKAEWFTDSISNFTGKDAMEQVMGKWIIELSEMVATKKTDIERTKSFISAQCDTFRPSYGKNVLEVPRQCSFFGTTNEDTPMRDMTGNRRFWVLDCPKTIHDPIIVPTEEEVNQIWAEAYQLYLGGAITYLSPEATVLAKEEQENSIEKPMMMGNLEQYLNRLVPAEWRRMTKSQRAIWLDNPIPEGTHRKDFFCPIEIWAECYQKEESSGNGYSAREISNCLRLLGYRRVKQVKEMGAYGTQRVYIRREAGIKHPTYLATAADSEKWAKKNNGEGVLE